MNITLNKFVKKIEVPDNIVVLTREFRQDEWWNDKFDIFLSDRKFTDQSIVTQISGTGNSVGFFGKNPVVKQRTVAGDQYPTTSSFDKSGNSRLYLSKDVDVFSSGTIDAYRSGIEITSDKIWSAGLVKFLSDGPGHFWRIDNLGFDISTNNIGSSSFHETTTVVGTDYILGGQTYPIPVDDDVSLNGVIEAYPIRTVVFGTSIDFPYETRGIVCNFEDGSEDHFRSNSSIVNKYEIVEESRINTTPFFDACWRMSIDGVTETGPILSYLDSNKKLLTPFDDSYRRRYRSNTEEFNWLLHDEGNSLFSNRERSCTAGYTYDSRSTDSIAFGDYAYLNDQF